MSELSGTIVALPSLGADMDVGSVLEWRVAVGDHVERGDVIALVSTEKSDIDVESWDVGVVTELIAPIGEEIAVGEPLLRLGGETSGPPHVPPPPPPSSPPSDRPAPHRVAASPLARQRAAERKISLLNVHGTGPNGAVVAADLENLGTVETHAPSTPSSAPEEAPEDSSTAMRRAIAERMARSNSEIPHYHLDRDIDMTTALAWLASLNAERPVADRIIPAALLVHATARAAGTVPELNGVWQHDQFTPSPNVDLALVVSLRNGGLVTPTIVEADQLSVPETMAVVRDMVSRARRGQLLGRWMAPSSIAITNLGDNGADRVGGIIFPPHVALAGFGRITKRPWVIDDTVTARSVVTATLAADHRASDGADGSRFLAAVADVLEHPERLET